MSGVEMVFQCVCEVVVLYFVVFGVDDFGVFLDEFVGCGVNVCYYVMVVSVLMQLCLGEEGVLVVYVV